MSKMDNTTVIKTTARFQEANEPNRQKPIIRIDGAPPTIYEDFNELPNTIRASIDSGRDNPFRPDGKIYKSADPIVDYYKFGPNQSRANSPTDSQLLLNVNQTSAQKSSWFRRKRKTTSKKEAKNGIDEKTGEEKKKSCWRRICCCCSCSFRCCKKSANSQSQVEPKTIHEARSRRQVEEDAKRANDLALEIADSNTKDNKNNQQILGKLSATNPKQTKSVVVKDYSNSGEVKFKNGTSTTTISPLVPINVKQQQPNLRAPEEGLGTGGSDKNSDKQDNIIANESTVTTTKVKTTKPSKCIIS